MPSQLTISGDWLRSIQASLATVETSGQAYAAIWAAKEFADDAASTIKAGGSWWNPDPWRTSAAKDLEEAGIQISREEKPYNEGGTQRIDLELWSRVAAKISNLYALAKTSRALYPADTDSTDFDASLISGAASIAQAILDAPKAVVDYVTDVAGHAVEKVAEVGTKAVKGAGGIVREAASQASGAVGDAIPWRGLVAGLLILGAVVGGVVLLARSGALRQIGGIAHG